MAATIIDGKQIAADVRAEVKQGVTELKQQTGVVAGLATVLVGSDPASHKYVSMKRKACAEAGIESFHHELSPEATQDEVLKLVSDLGADDRVHGILVQLPLPNQVDEETILDAVPLAKDVDGAITDVQGTGLLVSCALDPERFTSHGANSTEWYLRTKGFGVIHGGANALRYTPHFAVTTEELELIVASIRDALENGPRKS